MECPIKTSNWELWQYEKPGKDVNKNERKSVLTYGHFLNLFTLNKRHEKWEDYW